MWNYLLLFSLVRDLDTGTQISQKFPLPLTQVCSCN